MHNTEKPTSSPQLDSSLHITGTDLWGNSLKLLMGAVVGCGALIMAIMAWMQKSVLTDPECVPPVKRDAKKKKVCRPNLFFALPATN